MNIVACASKPCVLRCQCLYLMLPVSVSHASVYCGSRCHILWLTLPRILERASIDTGRVLRSGEAPSAQFRSSVAAVEKVEKQLCCGSCSDKLRKRPCGSSGESLEALRAGKAAKPREKGRWPCKEPIGSCKDADASCKGIRRAWRPALGPLGRKEITIPAPSITIFYTTRLTTNNDEESRAATAVPALTVYVAIATNS